MIAQLTQVEGVVFVIGSELPGHLHNHWMRNAHMCALAIVMATCSYRIYFWRMCGNRLYRNAAFVWARL